LDGKQCWIWTRGVLKRMHVIAKHHRYCGKEFKRKLEQGPLDHENEFQCKVYQNGRVTGSPEVIRQLSQFTEREIEAKSGVNRKTIRVFRRNGTVTRRIYNKLAQFLTESEQVQRQAARR